MSGLQFAQRARRCVYRASQLCRRESLLWVRVWVHSYHSGLTSDGNTCSDHTDTPVSIKNT
jgi:hypothetical protein